MNNIKAIFIKQLTSALKVPTIIIQGLIFLGMAAAFVFLLPADPEYDCYVCVPAYVCAACEAREYERFQLPLPTGVSVFAVIFVGLALMGGTSGMVLEDKTTTNLRFMAMADVKPYQYLIGTLSSLLIVVTVMLVFFALLGGYFGDGFFRFMAVGVAGGLVSLLFGIVMGLSKIPFLAWPFSFVLGMGPTFASQNQALANVLRFTYVQQVNIALADLNADLTPIFLTIGANAVVVLLVFLLMHRKNKFNL